MVSASHSSSNQPQTVRAQSHTDEQWSLLATRIIIAIEQISYAREQFFCHVLYSVVPPKPLRDPPFCTSNIHAGTINFDSKKKCYWYFLVPKTLEVLVNDPSNFVDEICELLDTLPPGRGNYEHVARHYGYKVSTVKSRFETSPDGPSKALILSIMAGDPDVTGWELCKSGRRASRTRGCCQIAKGVRSQMIEYIFANFWRNKLSWFYNIYQLDIHLAFIIFIV